MKPATRVALVGGGYVAAFLLASGVTATHVALTSEVDPAASSGMYAFGDVLLFVAVFGVAALIPTAAGLYFLRSRPGVWRLLGAATVVVSASGVAALYSYVSAPPPGASLSPQDWLHELAPFRILAAPLVAGGFLLVSLLAPTRPTRWLFLAAAGIELILSVYIGIHWFGAAGAS